MDQSLEHLPPENPYSNTIRLNKIQLYVQMFMYYFEVLVVFVLLFGFLIPQEPSSTLTISLIVLLIFERIVQILPSIYADKIQKIKDMPVEIANPNLENSCTPYLNQNDPNHPEQFICNQIMLNTSRESTPPNEKVIGQEDMHVKRSSLAQFEKSSRRISVLSGQPGRKYSGFAATQAHSNAMLSSIQPAQNYNSQMNGESGGAGAGGNQLYQSQRDIKSVTNNVQIILEAEKEKPTFLLKMISNLFYFDFMLAHHYIKHFTLQNQHMTSSISKIRGLYFSCAASYFVAIGSENKDVNYLGFLIFIWFVMTINFALNNMYVYKDLNATQKWSDPILVTTLILLEFWVFNLWIAILEVQYDYFVFIPIVFAFITGFSVEYMSQTYNFQDVCHYKMNRKGINFVHKFVMPFDAGKSLALYTRYEYLPLQNFENITERRYQIYTMRNCKSKEIALFHRIIYLILLMIFCFVDMKWENSLLEQYVTLLTIASVNFFIINIGIIALKQTQKSSNKKKYDPVMDQYTKPKRQKSGVYQQYFTLKCYQEIDRGNKIFSEEKLDQMGGSIPEVMSNSSKEQKNVKEIQIAGKQQQMQQDQITPAPHQKQETPTNGNHEDQKLLFKSQKNNGNSHNSSQQSQKNGQQQETIKQQRKSTNSSPKNSISMGNGQLDGYKINQIPEERSNINYEDDENEKIKSKATSLATSKAHSRKHSKQQNNQQQQVGIIVTQSSPVKKPQEKYNDNSPIRVDDDDEDEDIEVIPKRVPPPPLDLKQKYNVTENTITSSESYQVPPEKDPYRKLKLNSMIHSPSSRKQSSYHAHCKSKSSYYQAFPMNNNNTQNTLNMSQSNNNNNHMKVLDREREKQEIQQQQEYVKKRQQDMKRLSAQDKMGELIDLYTPGRVKHRDSEPVNAGDIYQGKNGQYHHKKLSTSQNSFHVKNHYQESQQRKYSHSRNQSKMLNRSSLAQSNVATPRNQGDIEYF